MSACCQSSPKPASLARPAGDWFGFGLLAMLAGVAMTISLALNLDPPEGLARTVSHAALALITLGALIAFACPIFKNAARFRITLESLFFLGLSGAFAASVYSSISGIGHIYYEVTLILLAIYRLGQLISARHLARAQDFTRNIPGMVGKARRLRDGKVELVPVDQIATGEIILVRPEETIPVDGKVSRGRAYIEQLPHTGEPFPVPKHPGDTVLAGTRVLDGDVEITATSPGNAREIDRLRASLEQSLPSQTEELAQRVLNFFVPAVVITALLTAIGWGVIGNDWQVAIFHALAVTIVACPCGLGLAIPLAARSGLFQLRMLGIQSQDGQLLDRLSRIDTVVFDKTGTLTESRLSLTGLKLEGDAPPDLPRWLAAIQRRSTHPVARPFWDLADPEPLRDLMIKTLPARGIEATFSRHGQQHTLAIGNQFLLQESTGQNARVEPRKLHLIHNGRFIGQATLEEDPRVAAGETLRALKGSGYRLEIMTGDHAVTPALVKLTDATHTSLSTVEKGKLIKDRQQTGHHVLYIGDGLNDVEAMQAAEASLALGSNRSLASNVAHGCLDPPDLSVIPRAIILAQTIHRRLVSLLAFVLVYNFIGISLAVSGWLHPVAAAILMLASSATVLLRAAADYQHSGRP